MPKKTSSNNKDIFCSFCGRYKDEVGKIIAGPNGIYICDDCIDICNRPRRSKKSIVCCSI